MVRRVLTFALDSSRGREGARPRPTTQIVIYPLCQRKNWLVAAHLSYMVVWWWWWWWRRPPRSIVDSTNLNIEIHYTAADMLRLLDDGIHYFVTLSGAHSRSPYRCRRCRAARAWLLGAQTAAGESPRISAAGRQREASFHDKSYQRRVKSALEGCTICAEDRARARPGMGCSPGPHARAGGSDGERRRGTPPPAALH